MFEELAAELAALPAEAQRARLRAACLEHRGVTQAPTGVRDLLRAFPDHERAMCEALAGRAAANQPPFSAAALVSRAVLRRHLDLWRPLLCAPAVLSSAALACAVERVRLCVECGANPAELEVVFRHSYVDHVVHRSVVEPDVSALEIELAA